MQEAEMKYPVLNGSMLDTLFSRLVDSETSVDLI